MKKQILAWFLLCAMLLCVSCSHEPSGSLSQTDPFSPLFRLSVPEGKEGEVKLFALSQSQGFFYLVPGEGEDFLGGFVSPSRSVSSESVVKGAGKIGSALLREAGFDRATLLTGAGISHLLLKENSSQTTPLPENFKASLENALFFDDLTLLGETDSLLILSPIDFSEEYVLVQKARLPDFAEALAITHEKGRIWYALCGSENAYSGISFFEYGKNLPMGTENFPFDAWQQAGDHALLFTRLLEDGGALYLYRDLETNKVVSVTVNTPFDSVTCDPSGKRLCGTKNSANGGVISIFDLERATLLGEYETPEQLSPSLAIDEKGESLLFVFGAAGDAVLGMLNLTSFGE